MRRINPIYTTSVVVTVGRQGHAVSDDGVLDLQIGTLGTRSGVPATNPEQLFAAGYAARFQSAVMSAAREDGKDASASTVTPDVSLGKLESGGFGLTVVLAVAIPNMAYDSGPSVGGRRPSALPLLAGDSRQHRCGGLRSAMSRVGSLVG